MNSIALPDGTYTAIQWVLWAVLAVFFVMTSLGWLVASRGWLKEEDEPAPDASEEQQPG